MPTSMISAQPAPMAGMGTSSESSLDAPPLALVVFGECESSRFVLVGGGDLGAVIVGTLASSGSFSAIGRSVQNSGPSGLIFGGAESPGWRGVVGDASAANEKLAAATHVRTAIATHFLGRTARDTTPRATHDMNRHSLPVRRSVKRASPTAWRASASFQLLVHAPGKPLV